MKIEIENGTAKIYTPYNPLFVAMLKKSIGGAKWTGSAWSVPEAAVDHVRKIMLEVYGENDIPDGAGKVTVRVTVTENISEDRGPVVLYGKVVAGARGRDSGAKVGEEVAFIEKAPRSGGSKHYWETIIPEGAVFDIRNVPKRIVTPGDFKYKDSSNDGAYTVQVLEEGTGIDRTALREERRSLWERIKQINILLGDDDREAWSETVKDRVATLTRIAMDTDAISIDGQALRYAIRYIEEHERIAAENGGGTNHGD